MKPKIRNIQDIQNEMIDKGIPIPEDLQTKETKDILKFNDSLPGVLLENKDGDLSSDSKGEKPLKNTQSVL